MYRASGVPSLDGYGVPSLDGYGVPSLDTLSMHTLGTPPVPRLHARQCTRTLYTTVSIPEFDLRLSGFSFTISELVLGPRMS